MDLGSPGRTAHTAVAFIGPSQRPDVTAAMAFEISSTNVVVELGLALGVPATAVVKATSVMDRPRPKSTTRLDEAQRPQAARRNTDRHQPR
jgi:hypothetical protein